MIVISIDNSPFGSAALNGQTCGAAVRLNTHLGQFGADGPQTITLLVAQMGHVANHGGAPGKGRHHGQGRHLVGHVPHVHHHTLQRCAGHRNAIGFLAYLAAHAGQDLGQAHIALAGRRR